jgi:cell division protein FtsN
MAQARKKSSGRKSGKRRGWVVLLLGVGIGIAGMLLWQFIDQRRHTRDGIASLFTGGKSADTKKPDGDRKETETPGKTAKPRYDFYTILPETETVLPDRSARAKPEKTAKAEKPEEGVSYVLQAGSFGNFQDADQLKAKLALNGLVAQIQKVTIEGKGEYYRVRLGPFDKLDKLDTAEQRLKQLGIAKPLAVKVKKTAG